MSARQWLEISAGTAPVTLDDLAEPLSSTSPADVAIAAADGAVILLGKKSRWHRAIVGQLHSTLTSSLELIVLLWFVHRRVVMKSWVATVEITSQRQEQAGLTLLHEASAKFELIYIYICVCVYKKLTSLPRVVRGVRDSFRLLGYFLYPAFILTLILNVPHNQKRSGYSHCDLCFLRSYKWFVAWKGYPRFSCNGGQDFQVWKLRLQTGFKRGAHSMNRRNDRFRK